MKTWVVAVMPGGGSETEFAARLRHGEPAVVVRVQSGKLLFDVRTIFPHQVDDLVQAVHAASRKR